MAKVNKTRYAILGVLDMKPCSGYDIKKFCDGGISHFWNENFGHIYPVLKGMEQDGLITKTVEHSAGKPSRHVYHITPQGKEQLTDWLLQPEEQTPSRLELLLKLYFAKNIPRDKVIRKMEDVKNRHVKRLDEYRRLEQEFSQNERARQDEGYPYWLATLRYGILDAKFRIEWCHETIENIKNHQP